MTVTLQPVLQAKAFRYITVTLPLHYRYINVTSQVSGTTAVAALVRGNHMWLANAGDSRAILIRQTKRGSSSKGTTYLPVRLSGV